MPEFSFNAARDKPKEVSVPKKLDPFNRFYTITACDRQTHTQVEAHIPGLAA